VRRVGRSQVTGPCTDIKLQLLDVCDDKLMYAWCQLTQRDGDGSQADAIALFTSTLGVGSRELRRCLCICVKEFNMEQAAQFRDSERVDSSTGTAERLDAVKRDRSRC